MNSERAAKLAADLASGTDASLRDALDVPAAQALSPAAAAQIAALAPITFDLATLRRVDNDTATVAGAVAHPPTGQPTTWTFQLSFVAGAWRLVDGQPVR